MVKRYKKKPVIIESVVWTGFNLKEILEFMGVSTVGLGYEVLEHFTDEHGLFITTLEGELHASEGDYIIKGVQGEFYPCKPDIFAQTYEEVV